ncbi:MAG: hypothetical protein Q7U04_05740 [Bacteriovorax sp.]|nr:hypothetical protein [Bacteriovorax sp.]
MLNIRNQIALLFLCSMLLFANLAKADEQTLATISNDENSNTYKLVIDSDEDSNSIKTFYKDIYQDGKKISRTTLDYQVMIKTGMILEQRDKYVIMKLKSSNFDIDQGGIITVDTLYNGAKGTRKIYDISMSKNKTGWGLTNNGKLIRQIFIQTNKVMILGAVGIKNLIMK